MFEIRKIHQVSNYVNGENSGLIKKQQELLAIAYSNGYFDKPREMTLQEIAEELDISTSAASGRLRRGVKSSLTFQMSIRRSNQSSNNEFVTSTGAAHGVCVSIHSIETSRDQAPDRSGFPPDGRCVHDWNSR
jgi:predicted DNA-binding protein YlxM (UPF0122 family)